MDRTTKKEDSKLADLKFKQSSLEEQKKHIENEIKTMTLDIGEAFDKQKNFEEEQSYNRATQLKLLQSFDDKLFKRIKATYETKPDEIYTRTVTLLVKVLKKPEQGGVVDVKDALSDYAKLAGMMQNPQLDVLESVDEANYSTEEAELSKRLAQYGPDTDSREKKELCNVILHFIVFTIGISKAKRNLSRGAGRIEKAQNELINKKADLAKKVISAIDPQQIQLSAAALEASKTALNIVILPIA